MIEKQELYCHACDRYVQFDLDIEINGNHVLTCPNCGHQHCRVVRNGKITDARWNSRNGNWGNNLPVIQVSGYISYTSTSAYDSGGTGDSISWRNMVSSSATTNAYVTYTA